MFLQQLKTVEALPAHLLDEMNKVYKLDATGSTEVRLRWYQVALKPESGGAYATSAAQWVRALRVPHVYSFTDHRVFTGY